MKPLTPQTPHVVIMMGIPGSGKTHFAEHFAKTFHAPYINQRHLQVTAGIDEDKAEALSLHLLKELLKTQRTVVYEGDVSSRAKRQAVYKLLREAKYLPLLVWVQTDLSESFRRSRKTRENYQEADFHTESKKLQSPAAPEKPVVISGKHTYASQVKIVLKHLAGPHVERTEIAKSTQPRAGRSITIR